MVRRNLGKTTRMRRRKKVNYLISFLLVLIFSLMFDVFSGGDGRRTRYGFVEGVVGKSDGVLLVVASSSSSSPISRCRHCKKLPPEWKKAAKNLQGKVKLGYVNYDDEKDVMEEKRGSATICFVSFLPDILDSKAEGRNKYIEILLSVAEKFKRSPYRLNVLPPNNLLNITFNYIFTVFAVCSSYKITTYLLLQMIVLFVQLNGLSSPGAGYEKFLLQIVILIQYVPRLYRFLPLLAGQSSSGFISDGGKEGILAVELIPFDGGDA
ncbi:unnamed protein product [Lactuca saligna]|uniref:Thioredoxin domain-containing protein n=1 Tax=Lactuca saligna TaxID=75948 RepID=A0AA36A1G1_LACSI|nr:unnamed protein product [Lactuca saligna]